MQHPALLIVDEAPIGALLRGNDGTWIVLGDGDLAPVPAGMSRNAAAAWEADRRELVEMRRRMADLAGEINAGSVTRAALLAVGIDAETVRPAFKARYTVDAPNRIPKIAPKATAFSCSFTVRGVSSSVISDSCSSTRLRTGMPAGV